MLRVALIGSSSHWRIYVDTRLSTFSVTHVLPRSTIVKCHDNLERTKRWYSKSLLFGIVINTLFFKLAMFQSSVLSKANYTK